MANSRLRLVAMVAGWATLVAADFAPAVAEPDEPFDDEESAWEAGLISGRAAPQQPFDRGDEDPTSWQRMVSSGVPRSLDVRKVIAQAELLARVRTVGRLRLEHERDRPVVVIEAVLKGDPALTGQRGEIHPGSDEVEWAFFSWNLAFAHRVAVPESTFITALRRLDRPARADGLLHLQQQFASSFGGLLLDPSTAPPAPPVSERTPARLADHLHELVRVGLASAHALIARSAITTVEHLRSPAVGSGFQTAWCWNDEKFRTALLGAARHPDADVRRQVAQLAPNRAGPDGRAAMDALLVDPDPAVADAARSWYGSDLAPELRAAAEELADDVARLALRAHAFEDVELVPALTPGLGAGRSVLELFTTAVDETSSGSPARRAGFLSQLRIARTPPIDPEVLVWLGRRGVRDGPGLLAAVRHYADGEAAEVRRAACFALGLLGDADDRERLAIAAHAEDPLVATAAAAALAQLGDGRGLARLGAQLANSTPAVADDIVRHLGRLDGELAAAPDRARLRQLLALAATHRNALVRHRAAAALGRIGH